VRLRLLARALMGLGAFAVASHAGGPASASWADKLDAELAAIVSDPAHPLAKNHRFGRRQMPSRTTLLALALAVALPAASALPESVQAGLRAAGIPQDAVGIVVRRLSDGATILEHQGDRPMQPASTLKLVTSLAALETLGPTYSGSAELRATGRVENGVLHGELVLKGLGNVDFDWRAFERMLQLARMQGIEEVRGGLVLDLGFFQPARTDLGVAPFDEAPEFRYNVIPDALLLNTNLLQLDLASRGERINAAITPPLADVAVVPQMTLVDRRCEDWENGWVIPEVKERRRGVMQIRLLGDFPRDCMAATAINVIDRVAFAERLFRTLWRKLGGRWSGRAREGDTPAGSRLLAEHRSRTLAELMRDINKRSDNPITRVVFLTLGALSTSRADAPTARRADAAVRQWLEARGIGHQGMVLENGSGLSRLERIAPAQLASVLQAGLQSPWAPEFLASLPIAAVDGGMRNRLRDSPAAACARIKTGTLRDVTAVAGYVADGSRETYAVVAMVNHPLAKGQVARPIVDALVDWVARPKDAQPQLPCQSSIARTSASAPPRAAGIP
jgi:D-alanyl-D-alanine carboxypeptidase/D-alanyl-D-alanine-endopeptidase (penicillin-binding protein 4)